MKITKYNAVDYLKTENEITLMLLLQQEIINLLQEHLVMSQKLRG